MATRIKAFRITYNNPSNPSRTGHLSYRAYSEQEATEFEQQIAKKGFVNIQRRVIYTTRDSASHNQYAKEYGK